MKKKYENIYKILEMIMRKNKLLLWTIKINIGPEFKYEKLKGGMFLYGSLKKIDSFALVQKCIEKKVVFVPGNQFYMNKDTKWWN